MLVVFPSWKFTGHRLEVKVALQRPMTVIDSISIYSILTLGSVSKHLIPIQILTLDSTYTLTCYLSTQPSTCLSEYNVLPTFLASSHLEMENHQKQCYQLLGPTEAAAFCCLQVADSSSTNKAFTRNLIEALRPAKEIGKHEPNADQEAPLTWVLLLLYYVVTLIGIPECGAGWAVHGQ